MHQILHLLIVDRENGATLAAWHGSRWLLPVVTCPERMRTGAVVLRWLSERGTTSELAGQWLGRVSSSSTDWLMVMRARAPYLGPDPSFVWIPLETLALATPLIDYQGWAVAKSLERGLPPSVPGPFGSFTWLDKVKAWIGGSTGRTPRCLSPYRITAHEVVLSADTDRGRVYFKGLTEQRASEPRVTQVLAALAPSSFARTLAYDARSDGSVWWLTAGCPGTAGTDPAPVAAELARMQQRAVASAPTLRALPLVNLWDAARRASALVDDSAFAEAIEQSLERVASAAVPESWIPMDLDPTNVIVDASDVRYIDLDDSFLGPAPLAMAVFAKRCRNRSLYRVYEQSWSPALTGVDWPAFELAATTFEAWLGWQRVKRNTERGEVYGALQLAAVRIRERLVRAVEAAAIAAPAIHRR